MNANLQFPLLENMATMSRQGRGGYQPGATPQGKAPQAILAALKKRRISAPLLGANPSAPGRCPISADLRAAACVCAAEPFDSPTLAGAIAPLRRNRNTSIRQFSSAAFFMPQKYESSKQKAIFKLAPTGRCPGLAYPGASAPKDLDLLSFVRRTP